MKSTIDLVLNLRGSEAKEAVAKALKLTDELKDEVLKNPSIDGSYSAVYEGTLFYFNGDRRVFDFIGKDIKAFYLKHKLKPEVYQGDHCYIIPWHMTYEEWIRKEADFDTVLDYFRSEDQKIRPIHFSKVFAIKPLLDVICTLREHQLQGSLGPNLNGYTVKELKLANQVIDAYWHGK